MEKNYSALHNWSILLFLQVPHHVNISFWITTNIELLESDYCTDFIEKVAGSTFTITREDLQLRYLNIILQEIEDGTTCFSLATFIEILNNVFFKTKSLFFKTISQKIATKITEKIDSSRKQRATNKNNSAKIGENLFEQTEEDLKLLKTICGTTDFGYSNIADKVANEILQCGVDYFSHYQDSSTDPSRASMDLFKKAKSLAIGNVAKQRIEENIDSLQRWISEKPEREKQQKVKADLEFIAMRLQRLQNLFQTTINDAKDLIDSCKPKLNNIKAVLGSYDDFYLKLSTAVAIQQLLTIFYFKRLFAAWFQMVILITGKLTSLNQCVKNHPYLIILIFKLR